MINKRKIYEVVEISETAEEKDSFFITADFVIEKLKEGYKVTFVDDVIVLDGEKLYNIFEK